MTTVPARRHARGATLIEAVFAVVVLGIAIPPLVGIFREVAARDADRIRQEAALACAESLLEEIVSKDFEDPSLPCGSFGTEEGARSAFDDLDDYHGLVEAPPRDLAGALLAPCAGLVRATVVENVTAADPDPVTPALAGTTPFKRVRVTVSWSAGRGGELTLTTMRCVSQGNGEVLDEILSAASAARKSAKAFVLDLISDSPCDGVLEGYSLSSSGSAQTVSKITLGIPKRQIWSGSRALPTGLVALNAGSTADRTIPAGALPVLQVDFAGNGSGTSTYTLVLFFTNSASSTLTFPIAW